MNDNKLIGKEELSDGRAFLNPEIQIKVGQEMNCYFCKKKIKKDEKTATVQSQIGNWKSDPHIICNRCSSGLMQKNNKEPKK